MFPVTAEIEIPKIGSVSGTVGNRDSGEIKHDSAKIFEEDFQKWIELFWESSSILEISSAAGRCLSLRSQMANFRKMVLICYRNLPNLQNLLLLGSKMKSATIGVQNR